MFGQRLVTLIKSFVLGAGVVTALCMALVVSLQFGYWILTNSWSPLPLSRIVELTGLDVPRRFTPASVDASEARRFDAQDLLEWLLNVPAIVALFIALAVLSLFYASLASLERWFATVPDDERFKAPGGG